MSAHNSAANRRTDPETDVQQRNHLAENGQVSTRILLDSSSLPTCEACDEVIEMKARHKCLTVRDDSGTVREFTYCDEACLHTDRER